MKGCEAAATGGRGLHDVLLGAVVQDAETHILSSGHMEVGDAGRVELGTQTKLRTQTQVLHRISKFLLFHRDHPRKQYFQSQPPL